MTAPPRPPTLPAPPPAAPGKAGNAPSKTEPAQEKSKAPSPASKAEQPAVISKGEKLNLTIAAMDDVWIQLKADGRILFQNVMNKGTSETWEADKNFEIWTGNAEAMKLNLNGNYLGSPGKGVMRGVVIDRKGIKK